jgi:hypothetical protein
MSYPIGGPWKEHRPIASNLHRPQEKHVCAISLDHVITVVVNVKLTNVKLSLCLFKRRYMQMYGGVDVQLHGFFISTLRAGAWPRPHCLISEEGASVATMGMSLGPRRDPGSIEKKKSLATDGNQTPYHAVHSDSVPWLGYSCSCEGPCVICASVLHATLRAAAHQLRQDKLQDMRQKTQSCFIRDSDSSPHTEVACVCVLSYLF